MISLSVVYKDGPAHAYLPDSIIMTGWALRLLYNGDIKFTIKLDEVDVIEICDVVLLKEKER